MKNTIKWFGIIAFIAVIVFTMVGCDLLGDDAIDGTWSTTALGGYTFRISGSTGVFTDIPDSNVLYTSAVTEGFFSIGGRYLRNLKSMGNLKWSGQVHTVSHSGNVATGDFWDDCTFTLSTDGQTLSWYAPGVSTPSRTFTRQ
jgi:hypothetical protein